MNLLRLAGEVILQKVQFVRPQYKLHWISSSELWVDVRNLKKWAVVALMNLHCRISCFLNPHAAMMQNLPTVLVQELLVTRAMKLLTIKQKPGDRVC